VQLEGCNNTEKIRDTLKQLENKVFSSGEKSPAIKRHNAGVPHPHSRYESPFNRPTVTKKKESFLRDPADSNPQGPGIIVGGMLDICTALVNVGGPG